MKRIESLFTDHKKVLTLPILGTFIFATLILSLFLYQEEQIKQTKFYESSLSIHNQAKEIFEQQANKFIYELLFLNRVLAQNIDSDQDFIKNTFSNFIESQPYIDQLRYLSPDGQEQIRFNRQNQRAIPTPADKLQNKRDRYYFSDAIQGDKESIFISAIDLNIENQQIEIPIKPVIRFSTPIYDSHNKLRGIIVANILADPIISQIRQININPDQSTLLINKKFDWLIAPDNQIEWGHTLGIKPLLKLKDHLDFQAILNSGSLNQLNNQKGLFIRETSFAGDHTNNSIKIHSRAKGLYLINSSKTLNNAFISYHTIKTNSATIGLVYLLSLIIAASLSIQIYRKRSYDQQSKLQEEIINNFFEAAPEAMIIFDQNGEVFFQNSKMKEMFEVFEEDQLPEIMQEERRKSLWNAFPDNHSEENCHITSKLGRAYFYKKQIFIVTDGIANKLLAIILSDLTATEEAKQQIMESASQISTILDAAPDAIIVSNPQGQVLMANTQAQNIFNYSHEEFLRLNIDKLVPSAQRGNHHNLRASFHKEPRHRLMSEKPNIFAQASNGRIFHAEISLSPIRQNNEVNVISIVRDISDRKKMENRLRQSQKMEALGQLTGGISHDFNNLLTSIIGNLDIAISLLPDQKVDKQEVIDCLNVAVNSTEKAAKLTKRLLAFSRTEADNQEIVNIGKQIQDDLGIIQSACGKLIKVELVVKDHIQPVKLDAEELTNALINLATNARDAMQNGGAIMIKVANYDIDEDNVELISSEIPTGKYVALTFSDKGVGIEPDKLEKIFEPFYTTKPKFEGTGLGLSMVFAFVKQSNAYFKVYSEVGIGTTFKLFFPIAEELENNLSTDQYSLTDEIYQNQHQLIDKTPEINANILLVDDENDLLNLASTYLGSEGHTIYIANNSKDAIYILQNNPIDLVISDIVMPDQNGFELEKEIKEKIGDIPVIFCSGFPEEALRKESKYRKDLVLIDKPYRKNDLINTVSKHLQKINRG